VESFVAAGSWAAAGLSTGAVVAGSPPPQAVSMPAVKIKTRAKARIFFMSFSSNIVLIIFVVIELTLSL
jgi:hypothetical protein